MTTPTVDIDALIEDEWYAVRYSGEIPEVAYHGAVFHLTEAQNGPQIELSSAQLNRLLGAVSQRYLEITLRDLLARYAATGYSITAGSRFSSAGSPLLKADPGERRGSGSVPARPATGASDARATM